MSTWAEAWLLLRWRESGYRIYQIRPPPQKKSVSAYFSPKAYKLCIFYSPKAMCISGLNQIFIFFLDNFKNK